MRDRHSILPINDIKNLLAKYFSDIDTISNINEGYVTAVWTFTNKGSRYYLRVLPEKMQMVFPEAWTLRTLTPLGVKIPSLIAADDTKETIPYSYTIISEIPGEPFSNSAPEHSSLSNILFAIGQDLAKINAIPVIGFGFCNSEKSIKNNIVTGYEANWNDVLFPMIDERLYNLQSLSFITEEQKDTLITYITNNKDRYFTKKGYLVHGDFDSSHIFHQNNSYTGMIDFGDVRSADPVYDIACLAIHTPEYITDVLDGWIDEMHQHDFEIALDKSALLSRIKFYTTVIAIEKASYVATTTKKNPRQYIETFLSTIL